MASITEINNFKDKLREMDTDTICDLCQVDSALLVEMIDNFDPLLIQEAMEREEGGIDETFMVANKRKAPEGVKI